MHPGEFPEDEDTHTHHKQQENVCTDCSQVLESGWFKRAFGRDLVAV